LKSKDGNIKAVFLPENNAAQVGPAGGGIIRTCKANYRAEMLGGVVNCELQITEFFKELIL
jgi:hypothetical protein